MTISELIDILKEQGLYKDWNSNRKYWEKRFELLEDAMNNKGIEYFHDLERIYGNAIKQTENDIARWYLRYAKNEKVSLAEAKKQLTKNELKEFRMSVEEYVKKGESLDPQWAAELERASTKFHVTRLEALKLQMQQNVEYLMGNEADGVDKLMRDIFTDSYYHSAFEIQKGIGVGWDLMKLDKNVIDKAMSKPWTADGSNFSERIWGKYRPELVKKLHDGLTLNLIQGKSANELVNEITKQFNVKKHQAENLVQTEKAYFQSLAQKDAFTTLGVKEYEIVATLDSKTSDVCREMDGKYFKLDDFAPGSTAPPFHNRCRTATAPYFNDEFTIDEERAARDESDGSYYTVLGNMNYQEWYEKFIREGRKDNLKNTAVAVTSALPKSLENYSKYSETWYNEHVKGELSESQEEYMENCLNKLFENNAYCMRFNSDYLDSILNDGFLNQMQTNTSGGAMNKSLRKEVSNKLFGCDIKKMQDADYEKYGYLGSKDFSKDDNFMLQHYGDVIVHFNKDKVKTTYTFGDSLNWERYKRIIAGDTGSIDKVNLNGIERRKNILSNLMLNDDSVLDDMSKFKKKIIPNAEYLELQFHGNLTMNEVTEIMFYKSKLPSDDVLDKLKNMGIKVFVKEGKKVYEI